MKFQNHADRFLYLIFPLTSIVLALLMPVFIHCAGPGGKP